MQMENLFETNIPILKKPVIWTAVQNNWLVSQWWDH